MGFAIAPDFVDERGRAEHVGDAVAEDGLDDVLRFHIGRPAGIHIRNDGGHP